MATPKPARKRKELKARHFRKGRKILIKRKEKLKAFLAVRELISHNNRTGKAITFPEIQASAKSNEANQELVMKLLLEEIRKQHKPAKKILSKGILSGLGKMLGLW